MQIVELSGDASSTLGVSVASMALSQMTYISLVKAGLLTKDEAVANLRSEIAKQEEMLVGYPANRVAIQILKRLAAEVQAVQEPSRN